MLSVIGKIALPAAMFIISLVWLPQAAGQSQTQRQDELSRLLGRVKSAGVKKISRYLPAPSGERIVFVGEFEEQWAFISPQVARQQADLWIVNRDDSGLRRLTTGGFSYDPAWSPDEREIAYVRDGSVRILNLDKLRSRGLRALRAYRPNPSKRMGECDYHEFSDPKWSPDGKTITAIASNGCSEGEEITADTRFGNELFKRPASNTGKQ